MKLVLWVVIVILGCAAALLVYQGIDELDVWKSWFGMVCGILALVFLIIEGKETI